MSSRHLQGVGDQLLWKESPEQCHPDICTLPDTSREWGTSCSGRNLRSNVIQTSAHSQTPLVSGGQVALEGISRAMLSGCLHTPRHLQGVGDQLLQRESLEQCHPDVCTLPDTSQTPPGSGGPVAPEGISGASSSGCLHTPRTSSEWGTSCSGRNLQSNVIWTSAHSQKPPGSGGQVALEGISGAMLSRCLHTARHLQGVGDPFLWRESPEQCHLDVCTLPDTSREWGTHSSRGNLQSNVVQMSAHSQTPPGSVGPVPPDYTSRKLISGALHTFRCTWTHSCLFLGIQLWNKVSEPTLASP